jgi:hypothetical protein
MSPDILADRKQISAGFRGNVASKSSRLPGKFPSRTEVRPVRRGSTSPLLPNCFPTVGDRYSQAERVNLSTKLSARRRLRSLQGMVFRGTDCRSCGGMPFPRGKAGTPARPAGWEFPSFRRSLGACPGSRLHRSLEPVVRILPAVRVALPGLFEKICKSRSIVSLRMLSTFVSRFNLGNPFPAGSGRCRTISPD